MEESKRGREGDRETNRQREEEHHVTATRDSHLQAIRGYALKVLLPSHLHIDHMTRPVGYWV